MSAMKKTFLAAAAAVTMTLAGCASLPDNAGENPNDPWEKLNRQTFVMNSVADVFLIRPIAKGYIWLVPQWGRDRVSGIFSNLGEPANALNNALQGKGEGAMVSVFRLLINTTFGLGGMFDVAGSVGGQAARKEDFGQTLQVWGVPTGPYFVIPFLGPSTVTDTAGLGVGYFTGPATYIENDGVSWGIWGANALSTRAEMMPATDMLRDAVDPYVMAREAYLSMRRNAVYDGDPPMTLTPDEFEDEEDKAAPEAAKAEK